MAPALRGNHWHGTCPRCGAPVVVGGNGLSTDQTAARRAAASAHCFNCGKGPLPLDALAETPGDRLLVDKTVFLVRAPRRWEMAVFRCPVDPGKPYVKRVAGLPGESVQVRGGDLVVNGQLARKALSELRTLAVPVFEQRFLPPGGWGARWAADGPGLDAASTALLLDGRGAESARWLAYRNWLLDEKAEEPLTDFDPYNGGGLKGRGGQRPNHVHDVLHLIHDFVAEFELVVTGGAGTFSCALADGRDEVVLELPAGGGDCRLLAGGGAPRARPGFALEPGKRYRVCVAFADRRAQVSVDGRELFPPLDLPAAERRPGVSRPVRLGARGLRAEVHGFRLGRDVHYINAGRHAVGDAHRLGPGEYFMLGDNSANSEDSRRWAVPAVAARALVGKPVLRHQPAIWTRWQAFGRELEMPGVDWDRVGRLR
jgi:type IV secretory pathway protease TraF